MTWIVGTPSMMGFSAAVSDIRVSVSDGRQLDCLQKIHEVGPFIAAGFAGSVRFGFWAVNDLRHVLAPVDADHAWIPRYIALRWRRRARKAFSRFPEEERRLNAQIMLIGVSPIEDLGIPGWGRPTVAILRSPEFIPRFLEINEVGSIGSGANVERLQSLAERLEQGAFKRAELEAAMPGASAEALRDAIFRVLSEHPQSSVSPHVHLCEARRGFVKIEPSNFLAIGAEGGEWRLNLSRVPSEVIAALETTARRIVMPSVATTWAEFEAMCTQQGVSATAAATW